MSNVIYESNSNSLRLIRYLDDADSDAHGDPNAVQLQDPEYVEYSEILPVNDSVDTNAYLTLYDDSGESVTYLASDIDNLIEALRAIREEARL